MSKSLRILILEDRPADAELIQFELQEAEIPFTAKVVMTEKDFIHELDEYCPDIILSDYELPTYNGSLALAEAKKRCPDTPFILVTGAIVEDLAIEILTRGAKDYVLKTRLEQRLAPAVKRALAEAEEHRARKQAQAELREAHRTLEERVKIRTAELEAEIAERKKIEEALHKSNQKVAQVLDSIQDDFYVLDRDWNFVYASRRFTSRIGKEPEDFIGNNIWKMFPKHIGTIIDENYRATMEKREVRRFEMGGKYTNAWYCMTSFPSVEGITVLGTDITERKQAEEALQRALAESERNRVFFEAVISAQSDAVVMYDNQKKVLRMNPAFVKKYGFNPMGLHVTEIMQRVSCKSLDGRPLILEGQPTPRALAGEKVTNLRFRVIRADGSEGVVEVSSGPIQLGDQIIGAATVWHDVTEQERTDLSNQPVRG